MKVEKTSSVTEFLGIHYKYKFVVRDKIADQKQLLSQNRTARARNKKLDVQGTVIFRQKYNFDVLGGWTDLKLGDGDAVVSVADHHLAAEVIHGLELGGQEQTRGAQQLELARTNSKLNDFIKRVSLYKDTTIERIESLNIGSLDKEYLKRRMNTNSYESKL